MNITVLETYELNICCVCTQNGAASYLNIFENVIVYNKNYISMAQIINETLNINLLSATGQSSCDVCTNCKTKIVDFFLFKRRNEDARKIFFRNDSLTFEPPVKNMLLEVIDQIENNYTTEDSQQEEDITEMNFEHSQSLLLKDDHDFEDHILTEDNAKEETVEVEDVSDPGNNVNLLDDECDIEVKDEPQEATTEFLSDVEFLDSDEVEYFSSESNLEKDQPKMTDTPRKRNELRRSNPENWMRNKRKMLKNQGKSYIATNGKLVKAKQMKSDCGKCRMQCSQKINEENRLRNFDNFYQLADIAKQRKFLFDHLRTYEPKRKCGKKNPTKTRAVQRIYFLDNFSTGATEMLQVCKLNFLNTFAISSQMIDTLYKKAISEGEFNDIRGKFERKHSKAHEFCVKYVKDLSQNHREQMSITKSFELYIQKCCQKTQKNVKEASFREIYNKHLENFKSSELESEGNKVKHYKTDQF